MSLILFIICIFMFYILYRFVICVLFYLFVYSSSTLLTTTAIPWLFKHTKISWAKKKCSIFDIKFDKRIPLQFLTENLIYFDISQTTMPSSSPEGSLLVWMGFHLWVPFFLCLLPTRQHSVCLTSLSLVSPF